MDNDLDIVFKALSEPTRRKIINLVNIKPGISIGELSDEFEISRFGIRKHLLVLIDANLIIEKWERPSKKLYLNSIPIQLIYDRWLSEYSKKWASKITVLKHQLESENKMEKQIFVTYIKTTKEALWDAITNPDTTQKYYLGFRVESRFKVGSDIIYKDQDNIKVVGKIIKFKKFKLLIHSFAAYIDGKKSEQTTVTYTIEEENGVQKLTITHEGHVSAQLLQGTFEGWSRILSNLKTLLETRKML